jgi:hypothetical protein
MQFMLTGDGLAVSDQLRAYAEYRFFTRIARYASAVRVVQMTVRCDGDAYLDALFTHPTAAEGFTVLLADVVSAEGAAKTKTP